MKIYNLKEVEEASIFRGETTNITSYKYPVDENGNVPDYLGKDRVIKEEQMIVFDTRQEYLDYRSSNINP